MAFSDLWISPRCASRGGGHLLTFNALTDLSLASVDRKSLYNICCKSLFFNQLVSHPDTKWREHGQFPPDFSPTWRLLYKPPISKRVGDLQWRVLHLAIPTNRFVSRFNHDVCQPALSARPRTRFFIFSLNAPDCYLCFLFYRHCWGNLAFFLTTICLFPQ